MGAVNVNNLVATRPARRFADTAACAMLVSALLVAGLVSRPLLAPSTSLRTPPPRLTAAPPDAAELSTRRRELDKEFASIAAPAFIQFAAEPLARLVDTAYLGRLGPVALGGAGAAIAAQYGVAKLYNDPLLRTTISLVAASDGESAQSRENAVSSALLLALAIGILQALSFGVLAGPILTACCVPPSSAMRGPALGYLRVCAAGAPATTLWLATNGIFRGLGDTATPLALALLFTALNAILDPIFIFKFGMGAAGAAAGTSIAQTVALVPLLLALQRKLANDRPEGSAVSAACRRPLLGLFTPPGGVEALVRSLRSFASAGSLVLLRSLGKISAYSVCAREAARLGAVASAAHNLCFQLGVATTQLCESIAIATQTLLARELGAGGAAQAEAADGDKGAADSAAEARRTDAARHIVVRGLTLGGSLASMLALLTLANRRGVVSSLTTSVEVREAACGVMPLVLLCQALKGFAYPVSGALMGALDWRASAVAMWTAQASCVVAVGFWSGWGTRALSLNRLWGALALLFAAQISAGLARIASRSGPWDVLRRRPPAE